MVCCVTTMIQVTVFNADLVVVYLEGGGGGPSASSTESGILVVFILVNGNGKNLY